MHFEVDPCLSLPMILWPVRDVWAALVYSTTCALLYVRISKVTVDVSIRTALGRFFGLLKR